MYRQRAINGLVWVHVVVLRCVNTQRVARSTAAPPPGVSRITFTTTTACMHVYIHIQVWLRGCATPWWLRPLWLPCLSHWRLASGWGWTQRSSHR